MVGYKVGQKVLLGDGTFLNIENVQEGMSLQTIVLPNDIDVKDHKKWSSKEINGLEYVSSKVNKVSTHNDEYVTINELSLKDKEILVFNALSDEFQFKNVSDLYLGDDYKIVRIEDGSILLENIYSYEKSTIKEDLISISLHGPFHYLLDGYVVHNAATICIENCASGQVACINNTSSPLLVVGSNGFIDNFGSCWIPISNCAECTPTVTFIGQIASIWLGAGCENCSETPINPDLRVIGSINANVVELAKCTPELGASCPAGELGKCTYPLDGAFVTITNLATNNIPYLGQVVHIDNCCYTVVGFKGAPTASVIVKNVFGDCEDCCVSAGEVTPTPTPDVTVTPTPTRPSSSLFGSFKSCCSPFTVSNFTYTQSGVFGDVYLDSSNNCYTLLEGALTGGPSLTKTAFKGCPECLSVNPCGGEITPTPTPEVTPTPTPSYSAIIVSDCCTNLIQKSVFVPTSQVSTIISSGGVFVINNCCYEAKETGGDGSDGTFNEAKFANCEDCIKVGLPTECQYWTLNLRGCCEESSIIVQIIIPCGTSGVKPSIQFGATSVKYLGNCYDIANESSGGNGSDGGIIAGDFYTDCNECGGPCPTLTPTPVVTQTVTPTDTPVVTQTATQTDTPQPSKTPPSTPAVTQTVTPTDTPAVTQTVTPNVTQTVTPTDTPAVTQTVTPTDTPEVTQTVTPTDTPSVTQTVTPTDTPAVTQTVTPNVTQTVTPTDTPAVTQTVTPTDTPSVTQTVTPTDTPSVTSTPTDTPSVTQTVTPTDTPSVTSTPTDTPSVTQTVTPTDTPAVTQTVTPTDTPSVTQTVTPTDTPSVTQTVTPTDTPAVTQTVTPTDTPVVTQTVTPTDTPAVTQTVTPTDTPSVTQTVTPTDTPIVTSTPTDTPAVTQTVTPTDTPSVTSTPTDTPAVTQTVTPTDTPSVTQTVTPTDTPAVTQTVTPTDTPSVTQTVTPTDTPAVTQTVTPTDTPAVTQTVTPTDTPAVTQTVTPTDTPSVTQTVTPTDTPSVTQTVTPTDTPSVTQTVTPTDTPSVTLTPTPTSTPEGTPSVTQTVTPTDTPSPSVTPTDTPSVTQTVTPNVTQTVTPTDTPVVTQTVTPTDTPSVTQTVTPTDTPNVTQTVTPTDTPVVTQTVTPTDTPSVTQTVTPTDTPSVTPTDTPSVTQTVTPTDTPNVTQTVTPTDTPVVTQTVTPTDTPSVTQTVTPTDTPNVTQTVTPTDTPNVTQTVTPTVTPNVTQTVTPTDTPNVTQTVTPTGTPGASPTSTPIVTSTPTDTPSVTVTQTVTPTYTPSVTSTPTDTPAVTQTVTPTLSSGVVCSANITTGTTVTTTPTATPTPTPTSQGGTSVGGAVTYIIDEGYFDCGEIGKLTNCDPNGREQEFYISLPISYSGGSMSSGTTFNGTIGGIEYCLTFVGEIEGSSTHILTSVNSVDVNCAGCTTPDPTPTVDVFSLFERCNGTPCTETGIIYGETTDPNTIISNWVRFSSFAGKTYPGTTILSGLQKDGTIITNQSTYYFYTGATNNKYLGVYSSVMTEGENVGPSLQQTNTDNGKFYYNDYINKFIVWYNVAGQQGGWRWSTWDPTIDTGLQYGNPTATRFLTTSTQWTTTNLDNYNLTVSGVSNTVVTAINKIGAVGGTTERIECLQNSGLVNGFYSTCEYTEYTHEVTMGSNDSDDDTLGIVLAAFKDVNGLYGPTGQTQSLTLNMNSRGQSLIRISFNATNNTQAFTNGTGDFSTAVWRLNGGSPFGPGNYNNNGQVRFKIVKTSTTIDVYNTEPMGTGSGQINLGTINPYTLLVSIDLTDDTTWTDKPSYAVGDELLRFSGGTQFGYLTASQSKSQFYDIVFSGSQITNDDSLYGVGLTNPGANTVSTFNEVAGCWDYISEVTGYTGPSYSLTLDTGYANCTQCPTSGPVTPLPSSTPPSTPASTPTPTPTTPNASPTVTPTPTATLPPSGSNNGFISAGVIPCNTFCGQYYFISSSMTYDGTYDAPTFIYGLQNWGGNQDNPAWFAFRSDVNTGQTGPGNDNTYRVAQVIKETDSSSPNFGVYGAVTSLYGGSCYPTGNQDCIPL